MENKVRFNLKNVHYAKYVNGVFATPVAVPGAVSLDLSPEGELTKFYADGIVYYAANANNGYSGSLEMARFPDKMLEDIWGYNKGATSKVLTENANVEPATFALLYQIDGDNDHEFYALYACTGTRPGIGSKTLEESKEIQTQSSTITAVPMADGRVFARTTADSPASTKNAWFNAVCLDDAAKFTVSYNANGGTGAVLDGNSPYASGATVTVLAGTGLTAPTGKTFSGWNTAADGSGTAYAAAATFTISANTILYAQYST